MEAAVILVAEEVTETTRREEAPIDLVAFKVWQRASCPENETDQDTAEPLVWRHESCL